MNNPHSIKRIALLTDGVQPYVLGGMQQHSFYLAKYFAQHRIQVDLYHFNRSAFDLSKLEFFSESEREFINSINIPFPTLPKIPGHYFRASWLHSSLIYETFIKRPPVDFIYVQGLTGLEFFRKKNAGEKLPPLGVNFHGLEMFQPLLRLKEKIGASRMRKWVRFCFKNTDFVFSFGGKIRKITERLGVPENRIIEMPLGIEREWLSQNPQVTNKPIKFLFVGRYERRKGIQELNRVIPEIINKHSVEFHFAGPIPSESKVQSENVIYHGTLMGRKEMRALYKRCDVLVVPSLSEGMPNVILEAMACGLAVIATDVGAVSQLVNPANGFLISPGHTAELENAIAACCLDPGGLDKKRNESLSFVKNNLLWENLLPELLSQINNRIYNS